MFIIFVIFIVHTPKICISFHRFLCIRHHSLILSGKLYVEFLGQLFFDFLVDSKEGESTDAKIAHSNCCTFVKTLDSLLLNDKLRRLSGSHFLLLNIVCH